MITATRSRVAPAWNDRLAAVMSRFPKKPGNRTERSSSTMFTISVLDGMWWPW